MSAVIVCTQCNKAMPLVQVGKLDWRVVGRDQHWLCPACHRKHLVRLAKAIQNPGTDHEVIDCYIDTLATDAGLVFGDPGNQC